MDSVSESVSHSFVSELLSKLPFDSLFTRPRLGILGTQHVVAKINGLKFSCIFETSFATLISCGKRKS